MTTETSQKEIIMTVYSGQGKNMNPIKVMGGSHWEDIIPILKNNGYNMTDVKVIENTRKTVLEHPKAIIPNEDFNLHIYPSKTKGGVKKSVSTISRAEIAAAIKKHIIGHGEKAKNFFNADKSYTNKSTEELDKLLTKWEKKHGTAPNVEIPTTAKKTSTKKAKEDNSEAIGSVVGSLQQNAKIVKNEARLFTPIEIIKSSIGFLKSINGFENQVDVEQAITSLEKALILKPTPTQQELIKKEHDELGAGLKGVVI